MSRLHYVRGDIFTSKAQVIVNPVNCQGIMGKGLALAFKERYPSMFEVYQQECKSGKLRIGRPTLYQKSTPWILNFPTKDSWRANSKLEYLEKGLAYFVKYYKQAGITSIAFPKLGAQHGRLSWDDVGPLMAKYLNSLDIDVYIYISPDDKEYYAMTSEKEERVWSTFNDLAFSIEKLISEVSLSKREAVKILEERKKHSFTSLDDVIHISSIAKISIQRIKKYIQAQTINNNPLPGMEETPIQSSPHSTKPSRERSPKKARNTSSSAYQNVYLFPSV